MDLQPASDKDPSLDLRDEGTKTLEETGYDRTLVYPHEDLESFGALGGWEWIAAAKIVGQQAPLMLGHRTMPTSDRQSRAFRFMNGHMGAEVLPRKLPFGELVHELGYLAPRSVYIQAASSAAWIEHQTQSALPDQTSFFAKPVDGVLGRGTGHFDSLRAVAEAVEDRSEAYLIQSDETPQEDWRYVLQRDAKNSDQAWRIAYKKIRPNVVGDGSSTIEELVREATDIPEDKKSKIIQKIGDRASRVPAEGQLTEVAESGNISNGAYGQLPNDEELRKIDSFMQHFVADLEPRIGTKLNVMCFDPGVKDKTIFKGDYDFEKMKETVVFYEFQIPFGITGYLDELYSRDGRTLERLANLAKRVRLQTKFAKSVLANLVSSHQT